jgi:hypothetical protein
VEERDRRSPRRGRDNEHREQEQPTTSAAPPTHHRSQDAARDRRSGRFVDHLEREGIYAHDALLGMP